MNSNCFARLIYLIRSDLWRYAGRAGLLTFLKSLLLGVGFKYSFWMRLDGYFSGKSKFWLMPKILTKLILHHYMFKFGISIAGMTDIGPGFYIGHFSNIVISPYARIGANCNISQGCTIGRSNRGKRKGTPTLGDNVYIGPGAKLFGNITIGNNVAIGANAVVNKDVPDNAVVAGIPAEVISYGGSEGMVNKTDY